jgi:hypothetical protein
MDARLLTGQEETRFREIPDLSQQPQLTNPNEYLPVQPGPALALAQQAQSSMPMRQGAPSPATAPSSQWTPERKAFADKIHATARAYKQAVEGRRLQRQEKSAYGKLKHQLDASAGTLADLKSMEDTYQDIYTPDSPATMALQRQQMHHFEKVQRLRQELNRKAQQLNKQFGMKLGKHGGLEDEDSLAEAGDAQFDDEIRQGYIDALTTQPPP